jgi:hypothetical protein
MTPAPARTPPAAPQYVQQSTWYVFQMILSANQQVSRLPVQIANDADFILTGIHGTSTADFTVNFRLPNGDSFATAQMHKANFLGTPNQPTPIGPSAPYRAGSTGPMLDLTDLSGAPNTLEIIFSGIKRMKV